MGAGSLVLMLRSLLTRPIRAVLASPVPRVHRAVSNAPVPKPLHLLLYTYTEDALTRRAPHRAAHLASAVEAQQRGGLVLGGALADPLDGGVLAFAGGREVAEAFAKSDP